jgi:putative membrane-bound dehydrogenase-like protein
MCAVAAASILMALPLPSFGEEAPSETATKANPPEPQIIKQGGYIEKVEPGVDYKDRMPRFGPREPAESLRGMHLISGFRVELVAAEPMVRDPVDLAFDEDGRLYVAEMTTYSERRDAADARISLLEDVDGDGVFDKSTVFADELQWPTGLACFDGGVFVASTPDLFYFKDTDGDGRADAREVVFTGFSVGNPNQCPNSIRWNLDNRFELMPSGGGGLVEAVRWRQGGEGRESKPVQVRGRDMSFAPRSGQMRLESGGSQFGMTFDEWGRKFESSNSAPIEMVMYEDRYLARNPYLPGPTSRTRIWVDGMSVFRKSPVEPWRVIRTEMRIRGVFSGPIEGGGTPAGYFTGACGVTIYNGDAWPESFQGNAFVCEGASNLVHRMRLEPNGVEMTAHRTERKHEFWTSDETWFRPIQFTNAPDGALYVADMYREVYEHPDAVPPSVKKYIDLNAGNDRGRIYRVVPEGFRQPRPPRLSESSTEALVQLLAHRNGWKRRTASRLLYQRQDKACIEPLAALAAESPSPLGRMHALYALAGQNALTADIVLPRLHDPHPRVREHAVRVSEHVLDESPAVRARLYAMSGDDDPRVRYQLAFTLGDISSDQATAALADISRRDVSDKWVRLAVLSSCFQRPGLLVSHLCSDPEWRRGNEARKFLEQLAEQAGLQKQRDQVGEVLKSLDRLGDEERQLAQGLVRGLSNGLAKSKSPLLALVGDGSRSRAGQLLQQILEDAQSFALDEDRPVAQRAQAARSLAMASFEKAEPVLVELLDGRQPEAVQTAALQTLSRFTEPAVATRIVDAWRGFSPKVRGEASEAIFARRERLDVLLDALKEKRIATSQLDPARIQFLLAHPDSQLRAQAEQLLGGAQLARREEAVAAYRETLDMKGDAPRGRAVFKRECAGCHKLEGVGYELGLPLQNVKTRGAEGLLLQILDPNREVNPTYLNYTVLTMAGRLITGVITSETATSITLTRADGEQDTVLRHDIDELISSELSIMPEGLEEKITKQEMADVIQYLLVVLE